MAARGGFVSSFHNLARRLGGGGGKQVSACSLLAWNVRLMVYRAIAVALDDEIRFLGTHHHHAPRPWGVWWIVKRSLGEEWAPTMMMLNSNMKPVKIHICSHLKSPLQLVLQNLRFNYTRAEKMDWKQEKYFFFRENFLEREGTMIRCRVGHSRAALKNAMFQTKDVVYIYPPIYWGKHYFDVQVQTKSVELSKVSMSHSVDLLGPR